MLKKLKKIYFKIYHLFKLIGIFILVFGLSKNVYAESLPSCYNDYLKSYNIGEYKYPAYWVNNDETWFQNGCSTGNRNNRPFEVLIPVSTTSTTYIKFPTTVTNNNIRLNAIVTYNEEKTNPQCKTSSDQINEVITYSFDYTTSQLIINSKTDTISYISITFLSTNTLPYGTQLTGSVAIADFDLAECPTTTPPEPTPTEGIYGTFLDLYFNKLNYLATGFIQNEYLITMIGIIIAWIVLELLLKILNLRGGKKG